MWRLTDIINKSLLRDDVDLPEVAEVDLIRHYTQLSKRNFGVDVGFYPLGSCTMKYNPKVNEDVARLPGFTGLHPYAPVKFSQGSYRSCMNCRQYLSEIFGMADFALQPAAGAHGELTGVMVIKKYFEKKGQKRIEDSDSRCRPWNKSGLGRIVRLSGCHRAFKCRRRR